MPDWLNPGLVIEGLQTFFTNGGWVLYPIAVVTFLMWTFIIERFSYYLYAHGPLKRRLKAEWDARADKKSWRAHAVRDELISEVKVRTEQNVNIIKTMVAVAPLLGLLGTVTGMIHVFDIMALTGNSSARLMAGGVFQATIPTMAGMVSALSGLIFSSPLDSMSKRETARFADSLLVGE